MDFLEWISGAFKSILNAVLDMLPTSPFTFLTTDSTVSLYLSYVNWFVPVYLWISILQIWLVAIGIFYAASALMRWLKLM